MKRIMVIGACGAGKSTFSKKLHDITGLAIYHLDQYYWKPNWKETPDEEWKSIVDELSEKERWIIDGNYSSTLDIRIEKADTIIYLNQSTFVLLYRITKRILLNYKRKRSDMAEGCNERFDKEFYHFVLSFNKKIKPRILKKIEGLNSSKTVHIIKNNKELTSLLKDLEKKMS